MSKRILSIGMDAGMAALLYFGIFQGNVYAENIFWLMFWGFVVISVLLIIVLSNDEHKENIKKTRTPRSKFMAWYSFAYDICFAITLAAFGFLWSGAIWWFLQFFAGATINSIDDELRKEKDECAKK